VQKSFITLADQEEDQSARTELGICLDAAAKLGRRTAEMHSALALGSSANPDFQPEPLDRAAISAIAQQMAEHAAHVFERLKQSIPKFGDDTTEAAAHLWTRRTQALARFRCLRDLQVDIKRIRIHGDYHLGQVLAVKNDFVILDFEGEPARSLAERRAKQCALKDVAGMLRSFGYAAQVSLANYVARRPENLESLERWSRFWEQWVAAAFLRAYHLETQGASFVPQRKDDFNVLLEAYLLDKALYELNYELENRPTWVRIPLAGIAALDL
jgi:maltose alpha-D-glucosyltransferase/alpha-amylase